MRRAVMVAMVVSVFMSCGAGLDATDAGEGNDAGGGSAAGGGAAAGGGLATGGGAATGGGSATGGGAGTDAGQPCTTDTWTNWGKAFFASNCVSCHTYNHASMGQQSYVRSDASGISFRVSVGDMPRGASLSSTDRARVEKYVNCGAP